MLYNEIRLQLTDTEIALRMCPRDAVTTPIGIGMRDTRMTLGDNGKTFTLGELVLGAERKARMGDRAEAAKALRLFCRAIREGAFLLGGMAYWLEPDDWVIMNAAIQNHYRQEVKELKKVYRSSPTAANAQALDRARKAKRKVSRLDSNHALMTYALLHIAKMEDLWLATSWIMFQVEGLTYGS